MADALVPSDIIRDLGTARGWLVAYSGGCDSRVLLEIVAGAGARLKAPVRAIHIDHGLHPRSARWADHCAAVCERLGVPLHIERVVVADGASPEAQARDARYAAFVRALGADEVLLTAHHLDDQAETLLLRLLRGTGVSGLAAMLPRRRLGHGWLGRPLLSVSRAAIRAWARERQLDWIEDPSNAQRIADRNFLRHDILPSLETRWPGVARRLAGVAAEMAEARSLLDGLADEDGATDNAQLDMGRLARLEPARQRNLLRRWIDRCRLRPPGRRRLEEGLAMLTGAGEDRQPELAWPGGRIRRYRDRLYLDNGQDPPFSGADPLRWSGDRDLDLGAGRLTVSTGPGGIDPALVPEKGFRVVFGMHGQRCRPRGRPTRPLKHLFQEAGIPPWLRGRWPVLYAGDDIAAVPGICICEAHAARAGTPGLVPAWEPR
ncbi:MAG: tRNA lysidine(34) synthetase TilS [Aquisalimonadaceae bacterium]